MGVAKYLFCKWKTRWRHR